MNFRCVPDGSWWMREVGETITWHPHELLYVRYACSGCRRLPIHGYTWNFISRFFDFLVFVLVCAAETNV